MRRVWGLERYEEEYLGLKTKIENINQLIKTESDRIDKNEAKTGRNYMNEYLNELLGKKREIMREKLEFLDNFPPLPWELLPKTLQNVFSATTKV